jgi:dsDNA-binding SOS-regulon protein
MADNQEPSTLMEPGLEAFLDSCLVDKGIKDVPKALHDQMMQDLAARLETWLMQAVFKKLEEKDAQPLESLMDKGAGQQEIMQFLQGRVPNLQEIFAEEMVNFKKAYLGA